MLKENEKDLLTIMTLSKNDKDYSKEMRSLSDSAIREELKNFAEASRATYEFKVLTDPQRIKIAEDALEFQLKEAEENEIALDLINELFPKSIEK